MGTDGEGRAKSERAGSDGDLNARVRCQSCGRFIGQGAIAEGRAHYHFIPDSIHGPEESYWECEKCK